MIKLEDVFRWLLIAIMAGFVGAPLLMNTLRWWAGVFWLSANHLL